MTISAKIFLALSLITLAVSFTDAGSNFLWGLLKPLGVIFFMLFLMIRVLAKEVAKFDAEEASRKAKADMARKPVSRDQKKRGALLHSARTT